jgi:hypothetical protein
MPITRHESMESHLHRHPYAKTCFIRPLTTPISGTLAEIYLQLIEELYIKHWIESQEIVYYKRYVDDILIIFANIEQMKRLLVP